MAYKPQAFLGAWMHTVELLQAALEAAGRLGYAVRPECLGGAGGGGCELRGRRVFFLDLDLGPNEQLESALRTLREDPKLLTLKLPEPLRVMLKAS
jgi:hypothetical protein